MHMIVHAIKRPSVHQAEGWRVSLFFFNTFHFCIYPFNFLEKSWYTDVSLKKSPSKVTQVLEIY